MCESHFQPRMIRVAMSRTKRRHKLIQKRKQQQKQERLLVLDDLIVLTTSSPWRNHGSPYEILGNCANFHVLRRHFGTSLNSSSGWTSLVFSGFFQRRERVSSQGMDKKCDNSKGEAAKKHAAADGSAPPYDFSAHLITGSPTEVSLQHPLFTHSLVVNTSAVSALASRGRLLGPWVAWVWLLHSLWSPCPWWPSEAPRDS